MSKPPSIAERAFQLCHSGDYINLTAVKAQLRREGYSDIQAHLEGRTIAAALRAACNQALANKTDNPEPEGPPKTEL